MTSKITESFSQNTINESIRALHVMAEHTEQFGEYLNDFSKTRYKKNSNEQFIALSLSNIYQASCIHSLNQLRTLETINGIIDILKDFESKIKSQNKDNDTNIVEKRLSQVTDKIKKMELEISDTRDDVENLNHLEDLSTMFFENLKKKGINIDERD